MERGRVYFLFFYFLFFIWTLLSRSSCLPFFLQNARKNETQKQKQKILHNGVRSWLAYPKSLHFQVFSLFLICRDRTRCTTNSIHSREEKKKKTFPYCFWFAASAQGAWQRAYVVRDNNSVRLKIKRSNNKTDKIWEI